MGKTSNLIVVCFLTTVLVVDGHESSVSCPEITAEPEGYTCFSSEDCTALECRFPPNTVFTNGTSGISLDVCDDPPLINFTLQWSSNGGLVNIIHQFRETGQLLLGQVNVSATVERNATSLAFSARSVGPDMDLIPRTEFSINTTDCLCSSLQELAEKIHSPFEHDCSATPTCDGITCQLEVLGTTYIVELDILSCTQPPGVDVLVKDEAGNTFYSNVVNGNTSAIVIIGGFPTLMNVLLIQHPYSIEVESNLTVPFYGTFNMVPRHSIPLDLGSCSTQPPTTPPTAMPTTPPTLPTPPPDAPYLCQALYNLANMTGAGFTCLPTPSCTSLMCELNINNGLYQLELLVLPQENDVKARIEYQPIYYAPNQRWEVVEGNQVMVFETVSGSLVVEANATDSVLTLQMILRTNGEPDRVLLPATPITLPSAEGCLWWLPTVYSLPQCSYLLECQGIQCTNYFVVEASSISLEERCADPITTKLVLKDYNNQVLFQGGFTKSSFFQFPPDTQAYDGYMGIWRNDTALNISAYSSFGGDILYPLVPRITVPLDQQSCSCQSLTELAEKTQSPLEHDCMTNERCDGIRCELDVFGSIFHLETILLSCNTPPAMETVLENESNVPLYTSTISQSGTYILRVLGLDLPMYVEITHHNYSMDVAATLSTFLYGNTTLVPPHTLFLDRSSCPTAIPPPSTPSPTPSPPTYPTPSSPTCQALVDIAKSRDREPFLCQVATATGEEGECDTLQCQLDIRASSYVMTLQVYPLGGQYVASLKVESDDKVLKDVQVEETVSFGLQVEEGNWMFDLQTQEDTLAIKVTISPRGRRRNTILIDSIVPLEKKDNSSPTPQKSSEDNRGVKIGLPVAAVLVCVAVGVVTVALVIAWQWRRHQRRRQFDFKPMKFSEVQDPTEEPKNEEEDGRPENTYEQVDP